MRPLLPVTIAAGAALVPVALGADFPAAQAPSSITIAASPTEVVYGGATTLSGAAAPARAGERVRVQAQPCGQVSFTQAGDAETAANGSWTTTTRPTLTTQYRARVRNVTSNTVSVGVRPRIQLRKVARRTYRVRLFAAQSFAGKVVTLQRFRPATGGWARVRRAVLREVTTTPPTIVSGVTLRARLRTRLRLRVVLPATQARPCYLPGRSNVIRS